MSSPKRSRLALLAACVAAAAGVQVGLAHAQSSHVVQPGETLWGISGARYGQATRWPELQQRNGVAEPRLLQPGTVLYFADGRLLGEDEAMVLAVTGKAWLRRGSTREPLAPGAAVRADDVLATEAGGFATLGLQDGSRSVIPPASEVRLERVSRAGVRLRLLHEIGGLLRHRRRGRPAIGEVEPVEFIEGGDPFRQILAIVAEARAAP